ncbi:hypothetical protein PMAYCL1PPCAC_12659 [Pristionchus mayeri]|uniref:Uncharacterized protein n=1 Tax=Pristionchus mayeri TaxID=1317129 RepID=A0AAN4ZNE3_9BILA|nr:hypothetical protein PMAYCL1PPCAC_12659 [Pristionchus mayeri]
MSGMLITQKPEYARKIEEDRLNPFLNDEVLLNLADKKLSNADIYTAHTYYNYAIVLNSHIERALACESPRLQPAVQRLCELSSLVGKAADIRVTGDEQKSLSAFTKALLARRAADLILVHHATSSLNTKPSPEWKVCVSALCRLALYWLAACKHTTSATSALVALEALEANSIRKRLDVDEARVERLLHNPECAEKLGDACGAACPSATSSPSRSGLSFTPTLISFVPLGGFERCIQEAAQSESPPSLTDDKYEKCIGALAGTLDNSMVVRRLVNIMRMDSVVSSGSFIDSIFPTLPAYPNEASFKVLYNAELSRFDLKCYLVLLMGWTRVCLSSRLSSITGASRLLSPAPLPVSIFSQHQMSLWKSLVLRAQNRHTSPSEHALSVQGVKKVTRLMNAPPVPLMGTLFYTIRDDCKGEFITELYARKIVDTICCYDSCADRTIFRSPQGGIEFDSEEEMRLLNDAYIFISDCEMRRGEWTSAERTLLMCDQDEQIVEQFIEVYSAWLRALDAGGDSNGRAAVETKLREMEVKIQKFHPCRSEKTSEEKGNGSMVSVKGLRNGKSRSPAISIEEDDLNRSLASSEYTSAPSTPFKNGTIFGAETPTFHTPGGRPSLWPGAIPKNLFLQATQNASSTPKSSRSSAPIEFREEEVQTDADDSVFIVSIFLPLFNPRYNGWKVSRHRSISEVDLPEEEFELESMMTSLNIINDEFAQRTQAKVDQLEKAYEEEREEERRRKEEEEEERRKADEEIRRLNEKMQKRRVIMTTPKTPSLPSHLGHRPLGAAPTVDAMQDLSSSSTLPRLLPQQQQLLQSYLQQPVMAAAAAAPSTLGSGPTLQQLLGAVADPASVQSPSILRIGGMHQGAWTVPRPIFPPSGLQIESQKKEEEPKVRGESGWEVPTAKPLSAFESAFMKKKEEEEKEEGQHKGCMCCASEEEQERWFAAYDRVTEINDGLD